MSPTPVVSERNKNKALGNTLDPASVAHGLLSFFPKTVSAQALSGLSAVVKAMIRFLGGSDPLDILQGTRHGMSAKPLWASQPPAPTPAITSKENVSEQLGTRLQTSLSSLAASVEQMRRKLFTTEPSIKVEYRTNPAAREATFTRLSSTREVNEKAASLVRASAAPIGFNLLSEPTRLSGTEEINTSERVDLDTPFGSETPPKFENDMKVTAGAFQINGMSMVVLADDTIRQVLERISNGVPNIMAEVSGNKAVLSTRDASEAPIVLGEDTSGFFAAMKWTGATSSLGRIADDQKTLSQTAAFNGMTAGTFVLNGVSVSVDPTQDSVHDVIDRINQSGADVWVSYDSESDSISLTPNGTFLELTQDSSGFWARAHVAEGLRANQVNIDGAFGHTGFAGARLDEGVSVSPGEFEMNGQRISVTAQDSIRSILEKINQSSADVFAEFDEEAETVSFTRKSAGALPITLTGDTSGFLNAVKMNDSASLEMGRAAVSDKQIALSHDMQSVRVEIQDRHQVAIRLANEVQRVSESLQQIAANSSIDSHLRAAVRAALANLVLPQGIVALEDSVAASVEGLDQSLANHPTAVLDTLTSQGGLIDALQNAVAVERHARAQQDNAIEISDSDLRTLRVIPGVVDQAEILIQGRLVTLLLSLPRMAAAQASTPDLEKAMAAYGPLSARSEHDPPVFSNVEKRATSPPALGIGQLADKWL